MRGNTSLRQLINNSKRAMLIGIGGGGDIVGTIPTADLLGMFGIQCDFGGLSWERSVIDPMPGPRTFDEVKNARKLNDIVWFANKDTVTSTGVRFAESGVAEVLGKETLLIDINPGPRAVAEGILHAAGELDADLIIGIDVGGDLLAFGNEPGLMSPLADSIMTAAFAVLEKRIPTVMGLFGYGSDGELTQEELERSMSILAREGGLLGSGGITREALSLLEKLIAVVPTEASRAPALYAKGEFSDTSIRSGRRQVSLSMSSTVTYYFSPDVLYEKLSVLSRAVSLAESLEEANDCLHALGIYTEYDLELDKFNKERGIA
ncbi:MAG TPA: DUF1152 domain-containing protein [Thermodesulfobacteriota bacterium]|nr:DUF1152 domain-containing protein [Thermodesulfobacteriota bacterium]